MVVVSEDNVMAKKRTVKSQLPDVTKRLTKSVKRRLNAAAFDIGEAVVDYHDSYGVVESGLARGNWFPVVNADPPEKEYAYFDHYGYSASEVPDYPRGIMVSHGQAVEEATDFGVLSPGDRITWYNNVPWAENAKVYDMVSGGMEAAIKEVAQRAIDKAGIT